MPGDTRSDFRWLMDTVNEQAAREGRKPQNPRCAYCRTELVVPGEDCTGCGRPCIDSFVAPYVRKARERG